MSNLPSGTVTFLFTDIEGSTALAQQFPAELPALLARHHAILHQAIQAHTGHVFQITGDAFCAAFHIARDALEAALDAQRGLQQEDWSPTPVRVRMGIHTGSAEAGAIEERAGGYVGYLTLTRVQRVMSVAHGGQVLLSNPTAELVRGELPAEVTLGDMGEHRLKGLLNPEHLWQLAAPDVRQDFPPLQSLNAIPTNLLVQLTSFVGREKEMADVKKLLTANRLVTLTGVGGTGKTRLSLQVGSDMLDDFSGGVWFVELAAVTDPDLVPRTIVSTLQLYEPAGRTAHEAITNFLETREVLLLLDNCEHLIQACAQLANHLLQHCSKLKILTTSREPLGIAGETIWSVPSFSTPQYDNPATPETLGQFEAVRLFVDRARAAQPNFDLNMANARAVAQICTRLDGIPLALELAAARVRGMTVEQIAPRLDSRFRLLTGGSRTALPRQQTLSAMVDWSYNLLSEAERLLFQRLAVFIGPFTLEAAEDVCSDNGSDEFEVLDLLQRLVDKSLVLIEERYDQTYYRLLETIRQYGRDKLIAAAETGQLANRHAQFFLKLAEEADHQVNGPHQIEWLRRLNVMRDNLRATLEWVIETGQTEPALNIARHLSWFWYRRSELTEGRQWLGRVLALPDARAYPESYVDALISHAQQTWLQLGAKKARPIIEQALALAQAQTDRHNLARALSVLGLILISERNFKEAMAAGEESKTLFEEIHDEWGYANALLCLGLGPSIQDDHITALPLYYQVMELFKNLGDKFSQCLALRRIGIHEMKQDNLERGEEALREALRLARLVESKYASAAIIGDLAKAAQVNQNHARSVRLRLAAKKLFDSIGAWDEQDELDLEKFLASSRATLDKSIFNTAVERGRAVTPEQAIEYALEED
jgi:predicted ATPase/class 3 adenylate cyclase